MSSTPDSYRLEQLGEYAIRRVLGEGGMGIVYDATERLSGMRVALKVLHSNLTRSADARARFFAEMRILASLRHPNIVQSLASREIEGKLVIVLEYLEGKTLRERLTKGGRLDAARVTSIARAVASALVAAHENAQPIVHRDLKPENLMLLADGSVKVMDFGVAKVLGDSGASLTTQVVGTVLYMSPEQAEGRTITPRTDVYSLGLVMYEMLSGRALFDSPSMLTVLRHHCETPPPPFDEDVRKRIPLELEKLVFRLLEKSPTARPDAREVVRVLDAIGAPAGGASPTAMAATSEPAGTPGARAPIHVVSVPGLARTTTARERTREPASPAMISPGSPRLDARGPTPALDTIGLIDHYDRRTRWRWLIAVAVVLVAAGAGAGIWWWSSSAPAKKSSKSVAQANGDEAESEAGEGTRPCQADACAVLDVPNLHTVDVDYALDKCDALAASVDPQARLRAVMFVRTFRGGTIDVTDPHTFSTLNYDTPTRGLFIQIVGADILLRKALPTLMEPALLTRGCPFPNVWSAVVGTGLRSTDMPNVTLGISPRPPHESQWIFSSAANDTVAIDARTCAVQSQSHQ